MDKLKEIIFNDNPLISINDAKNYNVLVFAYVGDAVFSLIVRSYFAISSLSKAGVLNSKLIT